MQLDPVSIQILWSRMVSVVDEAASGLLRTAYTPSVKEYHDFCCAVFDPKARMLAHSSITTAGFLSVVPTVMGHFIEKYPPETLNPGDVLITNDPWLASGHLIDVTVASPIYYRGELVAYTACIVHHLDMGGRMSTLESKDVYEEGLKIPILKLYDKGKLNSTIYEFMRANIRVPCKVLGDLRAQLVANHITARSLQNLLAEFELSGVQELADEIITRTDTSLRRKISALPDGIYRNHVRLPKIPNTEQRVDIAVAVHIKGDEIVIDYTGTSGEVSAAINCTLPMTKSYSCYPIKLALDPEVPNNAGALKPITIKAEEGSVVNCRHPASTWGRTMISHLFPEIIFGALEPVMPELVLAGNGGCPANEMYLHGRKRDGRSFMAISAHMGGFGGSAKQDGPSCLCFPMNTRNIPVEVTENEATMVYTKKELVRDSAGAGRFRGGFGQEVEFFIPDGNLGPDGFVASSVRLSGRSANSDFPVNGRLGGKNGNAYGLWYNDREVEHGIYRRLVPGDRIRFVLSGGGGYGPPHERDPERVLEDVLAELISIEKAREDYGVVIDPATMQIDAAATQAERARRMPSVA